MPIFLIFWNGYEGIGQTFDRSVIPVSLDLPWEIIYGPDHHLWVSEANGVISRINADSGERKVIFEANDYYGGSEKENAPCDRSIGAYTYGLAMHPDFLMDNNLLYLFYSYNEGSITDPQTRFKIVELEWDSEMELITSSNDLFTNISNGYDHWGGRMIAVKQNELNYLYFSVGDNGLSDDNCYDSPQDNPNNLTQDPNTLNGKIHRIHLDGSIPDDNPISGNSMFTRGHRNPQGLAFNHISNVLYDIEHGDRTDDEVNVLLAGKNYGWKNIRGYHNDGNHPGEQEYVENYEPNELIKRDSLVEPIYSWGAESLPSGGFLTWPTVAPSDGIYYGYNTIPEWENSLLVVTLKNGSSTDQELFQFKLNEDGTALAESTEENPNPKKFFGEDQDLNGRLRDVAISEDGKKLFLIPNNWGEKSPIIVYTYQDQATSSKTNESLKLELNIQPNPVVNETSFTFNSPSLTEGNLIIYDVQGKIYFEQQITISQGANSIRWSRSEQNRNTLINGIYFARIVCSDFHFFNKLVIGH